MAIDLDRSLHRLAAADDEPAALATLDDAVLARLRGEREAKRAGVSMACAAAVGAVLLGIVAANPSTPAAASPFSPDMTLAPSTLLAGQ